MSERHPASGTCTLPPEGWYCTLASGHAGSCPTHRDSRVPTLPSVGAERAVQDDGLDVERLRDAIGSVFGYLARPDADKVAAAYRAGPPLHDPQEPEQ